MVLVLISCQEPEETLPVYSGERRCSQYATLALLSAPESIYMRQR